MAPETFHQRLNSPGSFSEWFKTAAWNVVVGTVLIGAAVWALFHLPILALPQLAPNPAHVPTLPHVNIAGIAAGTAAAMNLALAA